MKALHPLLFILLTGSAPMAHAATDSTATTRQLGEVTVKARTNTRQFVESMQMGKTELPVAMLLKAPAIGGEADVVKALQLTPGVKSGTEGSIGMYVRGGANDENLILLDGAPLYNAGHLLGFFSVFNNTALKDVQLYKSGFGAKYGGRLSSVMDVRTKEASLSEYRGDVSIGTISSSASVQVPVVKDKASLMVAGRRTYIDQVMKTVPYHFHDLNAKLYYMADSRNRFYISGYTGSDVLKPYTYGSNGEEKQAKDDIQSGMKMGNKTLSARWNHVSKDSKLSGDVTAYYSGFSYAIDGKMNSNTIHMQSAIRDMGVNGDVRLAHIAGHKLSAGFQFVNHYFNPNIVSSNGPLVERFGNSNGQHLHNNEAAIYVNDELRIDSNWQVAAGMRISGLSTGGKLLLHAEPRLGVRYMINERSSIKASYARMVQYLHMVSGSSLLLPTDLWYPATDKIQPAISDQTSLGYYYSIPNAGISISAEAYYKWMQHLSEYKEGAVLLMNDKYEDELVQGKGRAYGLELFVSKTAGRFTGWAGYTWSVAQRQFDSLNGGKEYYARYDRRHQLSLVGMYDVVKNWSVSTTVVYATGSPFTGQTSQYLVPKPGFAGLETLPAYTGRNEMRMSAAFRTDVDVAYKFGISRHIKADAHLSVYNVFNRTQPHSVRRVYDEKSQTYKYQQQGLFGTIMAASLNIHL